MTIIVLGIQAPETLTTEALLGLWPQALAYAVSFLYVGKPAQPL